MVELTVAVCTYNRSDRLQGLICSLRNQKVDTPWEILIIDNNSTDSTASVLASLSQRPGAQVRVVKETEQGIVHARNRAIKESLRSAYLLFMDDDELPASDGVLQAAVDALRYDGAACVGGKISIGLEPEKRPLWLGDELLGFLGKLDYGPEAFWIRDKSTPIWSGIVAYRTSLFRINPTLRFDLNYNRAGHDIGGGEDKRMFLELLRYMVPIRYQPSMEVIHFIEPFKLKRWYFLKLHFLEGMRLGHYENGACAKTIFGIPPYMVRQTIELFLRACIKYLMREKHALRHSMTFFYSVGVIYGRFLFWRKINISP
jgi:succinoglycan biosynthesis protein ExoM